LPAYKEGTNVYPCLSYKTNNYYFNLYFKGAGTYYVIEEITLKDSTKLKYRYGDITVQVSSVVNLGTKIPQNLFVCADSTVVYGNTYLTRQERPVGYTWKKDGAIFKKTTAGESPNLTVKQSGTYALETTYKGGCIANATPVKVELNKMQVILTDVPSFEICDGASITLYSNIYFGYPFSDTIKIAYQILKDGKEYAKGFTSQDSYHRGYSYFDYSFKEAGTYSVKTQQGKCQGASNDLVIKTIKVPNSINYADSVSFCQTQTINLKTAEDAALSYLWERDGGFIKDANKATLEVKEAGIYRSLNRNGACWNYTPKVRAKVLANISPTATLTGDKNINYADTAKVSIAFTSHAPWTFKLSDGKEYTATKSPFEVSLRPQFSTNYTLTEVKNVCGTGTISGSANIKVLVLSSELEEGVNLNVFPIPSKEDVNIQLVLEKPEAMEWTLNSVSGNVLFSESQPNKSSKHESNVSLKSLPQGTYYLRIQAGEKSLVRKIIKTN
jgi:Secretion system C-terminal sorting domain